MKKESWTLLFVNSCVLVGFGIRWLSRCIMYVSTSTYVYIKYTFQFQFNREQLQEGTDWLVRYIKRGCSLVYICIYYSLQCKDGILSYKRYYSFDERSFQDGVQIFKNIQNVIGDDCHDWSMYCDSMLLQQENQL